MGSPKPAPAPAPTPLPNIDDVNKQKKKNTAEEAARRTGSRLSTILTDSNGKLGA